MLMTSDGQPFGGLVHLEDALLPESAATRKSPP